MQRLMWRRCWCLPFLLLGLSCSKGKSAIDTAKQDGSVQHRIVSLAPAVTETLSALGFESQLVGRSRFCDYPSSITSLPAVGGFFDPNVEAILGLRPDLLFATKGPLERSLAGLPSSIQTRFFELESANTIAEMARAISKELGEPERGIAFANKLNQDLQAIAKLGPIATNVPSMNDSAAKDRPLLRVLLLVGVDPIVASGDQSFPGELLRVAGGVNAIRPTGALQVAYPVLSLETLATLDPDLLLRFSGEGSHRETEFLERYPTSKALRVVREKRVIEVRDDRMLRPGPRMAEAAKKLRTILENATAPAHGAQGKDP